MTNKDVPFLPPEQDRELRPEEMDGESVTRVLYHVKWEIDQNNSIQPAHVSVINTHIRN